MGGFAARGAASFLIRLRHPFPTAIMRHVLLCDDDLPLVRAMEVGFLREGYRASCCFDGQSALESILRDVPDLLITDYCMPRLNGVQLIEKLRAEEQTRALPIIVLTAKGHELDLEKLAGRYGIHSVISKPFSPRALIRLVNATLVAVAQWQAAQ
ncbi:MAG: response regulator [Pirellula sp.]|nr:response regulator [Pirellula sp.]